MRLNTAQEKAVKALEGPVIVLAGPGTGKTTVLTHRIFRLLESGVAPEKILALTFTEAATHEMQNRIIKEKGEAGKKVVVSTFHGFCNSLIEKHPEKFGLAADHIAVTDVDRYQIVHSALDNLNPQFLITKRSRDRYFYTREIVKKISLFKKEGVDKSAFESSLKSLVAEINEREKAVEKQDQPTKTDLEKLTKLKENLGKLKELWQIYEYYQGELKTRNAVDFEDMIRLALEKFRTDAAFRKELASQYEYILVDEYQDTNNAQNEIVFRLVTEMKKPNLFVVGDDDQSIYRFQGASTKNLLDFAKKFPSFRLITLTENNRSTRPILELAETVISQNPQRIDKLPRFKKYRISKKLKAVNPALKDKSVLPQFVTAENRETELKFIISEIKNLLKRGFNKNEIAVLARTNKEAAEIAHQLAHFGIPYLMGWKENVLNDALVVRFIASLTALIKPDDQESFFIFLTNPIFELKFLDVVSISRQTRRGAVGMLEVLAREAKNKPPFKKIVSLYQKLLRTIQGQPPLEAWSEIIKELGLKRGLPKETKEEHQNNLRSLKEECRKFLGRGKNFTLKDFLDYIELAEKYQVTLESKKSSPKDAVSVLTAHSSKGNEFRIVFVSGLNSSNWETKTPPPENIRLPEDLILGETAKETSLNQFNDECRLLFVAITRTKERLYLSRVRTEGGNIFEPSVFLLNAVEANVPMKTAHLLSKEFADLKGEKSIFDRQREEMKQATIELAKDHIFSPSSLNQYIACHQEFKYRYLYRIPEEENISQIFGEAIHKTLYRFFQQAKEDLRLPLGEYLLKEFKHHLSQDKFSSLEEYEERLSFGTALLNKFYEQIRREPFPFLYKLETWIANISIGEGIKIDGKIDRLDKLSSGGLRVIDYKSGRRQTEGEIRGTTKNSRGEMMKQLQFYKLLYEMRYQEEVKEGELIFLEEPEKKMVFPFSQEDLYQIQSEILEARKEMLRGNFAPLSSERKPCDRCITSRLSRAGL